MDRFTKHTGVAAPLRLSNVDTDQIIPAVYLKRITRSGFEDGLFAAWRREPGFVLNQDAYRSASVLVVGPDFGTGSSREHAVWALQNYGFKVIIGSRFGDIFRSNAGKSGLLIATVDPVVVAELWDYLAADPGAEITVDLLDRSIQAGRKYTFAIDDFTRSRLLEGMDDIASTLVDEPLIEAFEAKRPSFKPVTGRSAQVSL